MMAVGIADCFIKQSLDLTKSIEELFYIGLEQK